MIRYVVKGNFKNTENFLKRALKLDFNSILQRYAEMGLKALVSVTPVRTGKTAASWTYEIQKTPGSISLIYKNTNIVKGNCIVILLDRGHGNGRGAWIEGRHFIDPTIQPIFDEIADRAWKEVTKNAPV